MVRFDRVRVRFYSYVKLLLAAVVTLGVMTTGVALATAAPASAAVPDAPTGVTATAGNSQATVSWTAPFDEGSTISGYTVIDGEGDSCTTTGSTTCSVLGLTNGDSYTFTVAATNGDGMGSASAPSNSVTPSTVPDAPTGVTAAAGNSLATVSWTAPFDEGSVMTAYTVSDSEGDSCTTLGTTTCVVTGLTDGASYSFTVTATNANGTSSASTASNTVIPTVSAPDAPTGVTATAGNSQATVFWTAPFDGGSTIAGYTVIDGEGDSCTTTGATTCTVVGLANGDSYSFTVTATNAGGTSSPSTASNTVIPTSVIGGSVSGVVTDNASPANPVAGAPVYVCGTGDAATTCYLGNTGVDGSFALLDVADGTYTATVSPPTGYSLDAQTTSTFTVTGTGDTTEDVVLSGPVPPPAGTVVTGVGTTSIGGQQVPVINWSDASPITTMACAGGTVTATITAQNTVTGLTQTIAPVTLTEELGSPGTFTGSLPAVYPMHGAGTVTIVAADCPDPAQDGNVVFSCYIDPSGSVVNADNGDAPVDGATVTLLSSDSLTGTFTPVADGSTVMSPANRVNPFTTGSDGMFGWDTVPGFYEVEATKTGCGTATSAAFQIPPAVEDLQLVLSCPTSLTITTSSLPAGTVGSPYSVTLTATAGNPPYKWKLVRGDGKLPKGLKLDRTTGVISGTPTKRSTTSTFTVEVIDTKTTTRPKTHSMATAPFTIMIGAAE